MERLEKETINQITSLKAILNELNEKIEALEIKTGNKTFPKYQGKKIVVYGATRNMYDKMILSAKSLVMHTDVDKIFFLTEDDKIDTPEELPDNVIVCNVSDQQFFPKFGINYGSRWTYMASMRCALHRLFPQYDRMLWLDNDILVFDDISELFEIGLGDYYYVGLCNEVENYNTNTIALRKNGEFLLRTEPYYTKTEEYYNSAVCLMNLEKLRDGTGDLLINELNEKETGCPDQDIINVVCENRIYTIPPEYNYSYFTSPAKHVKIWHYSGVPNDYQKLQYYFDRYNSLTFKEIAEWRKARKEYLENGRNFK